MNKSLPRSLIVALWLLPLAATPNWTRAQAAVSTRIVDAEQTRKAHSPPKGFKALKDHVVKELELQPGDIVVDIGAGDGFWSDLMAKQVGPTGVVHAGEIAQGKVDTMTKKFADLPQVRPYRCPTDSPGLPPASCDLAFISETYHHFDKGTQVAYLKGLRSVLKPSGRLVSIDALHTQSETARQIVLAHGGDFLMTVKANQPGVQAAVQAHVPDPGSPFLPH